MAATADTPPQLIASTLNGFAIASDIQAISRIQDAHRYVDG